MIKINDIPYEVKHFPDGTQRIMDLNLIEYKISPFHDFDITWLYENDEEMISLYYIVNHIRSVITSGNYIYLNLPYVPNARMDRIKNDNEVFTLKYFCNFINSLNFDRVTVYDTHSNVTDALLNNISHKPITFELKPYDVIFFPDNGAMKRYADIFSDYNYVMYYGNKVRDWNTGEIKGLEIFNKNGEKCKEHELEGKNILMIDDIISYGGTMYYSAKKLKELSAKKIAIYVSHLENSFFDNEKGTLNKIVKSGRNIDAIIDTIYTTNSIYNEKYNTENFNIKLIKTF